MENENIRPWGRYEILNMTKIKRIDVNPNQRLSLQYHRHRDETWNILTGSGKVRIGAETFQAKPGDEYKIPRNISHRAEAGPEGLSFLEIATGKIVEESDIVRQEDDYKRA